MARVFVYDGREFPDPDPGMSVEQVKGTLADFYGEIANASVKETRRGDDTIYEFQRRVGTKGALAGTRDRGPLRMDNRVLAGLLAETPPADLGIIELTAELTRTDGSLDLDAAAARQPDVELVCAQAQDYAAATERLAGAMRWKLRPRRA